MTAATDERVQQWQEWADARGVENPLTVGQDADHVVKVLCNLSVKRGSKAARIVTYYNAILLEIEGYGVITLSEASMADLFLPIPA